MRKLNPQLEYYLITWGEWHARPVSGLSYPSMTAEARLTASPGRSDGKPTARVPHYWPNPVARHVENVFLTLEARDQLVLRFRYIYQMDEQRAAAAMGRQTRCQFRGELERATRRIAKALRMQLYATG